MPLTNLVVAALVPVATNLPPVVVEASRLGDAAREMPARVETYSRADVASSGARDFAGFLGKCANVLVRAPNAGPNQTQISLRGYGANGFARVKVIVDGEDLGNADMTPQALARIPLADVERVEILYGPQIVLHGGGASAGVVNVVTHAEDDYDRRTEIEVHGGSWNTVGGHVSTRGGDAGEGVVAWASGDWERSDGWRDEAQWENWSARGGVKKTWENGSWARVSTFWSNARYGLPGGLYDGVAFGVDCGDWKDHARDALVHGVEARDDVYGLKVDGSFRVAEDRRLDAAFTTRHRRSTAYSDYDVYAHAATFQYVDETRLFGFANRFALGTDLALDDVRAVSAVKNSYARFTGAGYAQERFYLVDDVFALVAGVRGEGYDARDKLRRSAFDAVSSHATGRAVGEAGLDWRPVEDVKTFARWSSLYHAPLADELFSAYGVPNLALAPETGNAVETGVVWDFLRDWHADVTLSHAELDDEILYYNYANCNAPETTRRDVVETAFGWRRDHVGEAALRYAYADARFDGGALKDEIVPLVPRQRLRLSGEWFVVDELAAGGGFTFTGRQRWGGDWEGAGGSMPDFCLFDVGVRWLPARWHLKGLVVSFGVDNLFDKRYADYGEWFGARYVYPGAGRFYRFGVRYAF